MGSASAATFVPHFGRGLESFIALSECKMGRSASYSDGSRGDRGLQRQGQYFKTPSRRERIPHGHWASESASVRWTLGLTQKELALSSVFLRVSLLES